MKDSLLDVLRSFVFSLCAAALGALTIALMLALYDIPRTAVFTAPAWALLLLLQAAVNEFLARRNPSMLLFAVVNAAVLAAGCEQVIARTVFTPASSGFPVFLRLCIWLSGFMNIYACRKEPGSDVFVRLGDVLILSIVLYMASVHALGEAFIPSALVFALLTLVLSLLISASLRAGGESDSVIRGTGVGGYLVLGALLCICLLLAAGLLTLGSGHVNGIVDVFLVIWNWASGIALKIMTVIGLLLARLFGGQRMMPRQVVQQDSLSFQVGPMEEMGTAPQWVVYVIMGLIALGVAALILLILWALRGTRFGRMHKKKSRRSVTRTSHALEALRALLIQAKEAVAFELSYRANPRSPQGLYVFAIRTCRIKRLPRFKKESPGAYIRRLHSILLAQTGLSTLDRLADMLDRTLYGDGQMHLSRGEADAMAAQLRSIAAPPIISKAKSE